MDLLLVLLVAGVLVVVLFDFTNGFHDTANLIATAVASRALDPPTAVAIAAVFTFLGPLIGGTAVADTVGQVVSLEGLGSTTAVGVVLCAASAAVIWNLATWRLGMPSSSSHALLGALAGAAVLVRGPDGVHWGFAALLDQGALAGFTKIVATLLLSPLLGLLVGYLAHALARLLLRGASPRVNGPIKGLQALGTAAMAFAHGANDAQKSMGVLTLILLLSGRLSRFEVPDWVIVVCASSITAGTVVGGWRIVRTVGFGIFRLRPLHALDAQLASAGVIFGAAAFGGPVSTTHVVSSAIMGVGAAERPRGVKWGVAMEIVWTWFATLPGAAILSMLLWLAFSRLLGAPA